MSSLTKNTAQNTRLANSTRWFGLAYFILIWSLGFYWWYGNAHEYAVLWFVPRRTANLSLFFRFATTLGEYYPYLATILLFVLFKKYKNALLIAIGGLTTILFSNLLKDYFRSARPSLYLEYDGHREALLGHIQGVEFMSGAASFPSGHTFGAFTLYTLLAYFLPKGWQVPLLIIATGVGISRMYLGQHFLIDVLAGALLGVFLATIIHFSTKSF
ncbi:MAG: hypothetical protein RI894_227 [Bacteroidota bacterium]|jgi:membrane-associated phospholipid phosphatase